MVVGCFKGMGVFFSPPFARGDFVLMRGSAWRSYHVSVFVCLFDASGLLT